MARGLELRLPPVALWLLLTVPMLASRWPLSWPTPLQGLLALLLGGAGALLILSAVLVMRQLHTTVHPQRPHETHTLVIHGPFRLSRNPIYLGLLLALLAVGLGLGSWLLLPLAAIFVAYLNRWQIAAEERAMAARFGPQFQRYCRRVRRWL